MKTSLKSIPATKVTLLLRTLVACAMVAAFSLAAIPTRAGDADADAKKALAEWKAAKEAEADAKKKSKEADDALGDAMARIGKGKLTAEQEALLANLRKAAAEAAAALKEAEARLLAARMALEKAITDLPDGELKDQLKRERDFSSQIIANAARAEVKTAEGLTTVTFHLDPGALTVRLPDDIRAGDTISGTVIAEPKGNSNEERATNRGKLEGLVIGVGDQKIPVSGRLNFVVMLPGMTPSGAVITPDPKITTPPGRTPSGAVITPDPKITEPPNTTPPGGRVVPGNSIPRNTGLSFFDVFIERSGTSGGGQGVRASIPLHPLVPQSGMTPSGAIITPDPKITQPTHPSGAIITPDPKIDPSKQITIPGKLGPTMQDVDAVPYVIPPLGQPGRPIVINGRFDGNAANTTLTGTPRRTNVQDFEKNTENVSGGFGLIAESPRKAIFSSPENVTGPMEITLKEGNTQTTGHYRNVGVNLTAPKTSLLRGESTELRVEVSGLEGLTAPVPLTLESQGVITMVGGNYQPLVIQPSQVGADGRYSTTRRITGVQAGGWGATATVVTDQQPATNATPTNIRTYPGDYGSREGDKCEHGGTIVWRRHQTQNCVVTEISQVECGETKTGKDLAKDLEKFVKKNGKEWGKRLLSKATAAADVIKAVVTIYRTSDLQIHVVRPWEDVDITYECRDGVWVSTGSKVVDSGEENLGWHKLMVPHGGSSLCWTGTESVGELREAVDAALGAVCPGEAVIVR